MSIFSRVAHRALTMSSSVAAFEADSPSWLGGKRTVSGKRVNGENALRMVAVWACVSLIADGVSALPVDVYTKVNGQRREVPNPPTWTKNPNPFTTAQEFWHRVIVSMTMDGNAFIYTDRNARGEVAALYCLAPGSVEIMDRPFGDNLYRVNGAEKLHNRSEILHIPAFTMPGRSRGLSPIDVAAEAVSLGLTAEEFGARFFSQGTTMAGVITHPGVPKTDEAKLLREMFRKTHSGINNSHAVGVLTGGATWTNISVTPEQAQFLETRRFQKGEIALLYRVPGYIVDPTVTSTWGSGIEEQNTWFVQTTLMPWIVRIEQAVSRSLLPGNQFIKFNLDARLRAKTAERYATHVIAINNGIMSIDEVRALEDLPPLPKGAGKEHVRPLNVGPVGAAPAPVAAPVAPPTPTPAPTDPLALTGPTVGTG